MIGLVWSFISDKALYLCALAILLLCSVSLYYRSSLVELEAEVKRVQDEARIKSEYIQKLVEVEKVVYKDRIKYIKEYVYDDDKSSCQNAIALIRRTSL